MGDGNHTDYTKENLRIGRENRLVAERLARRDARPQVRASAEELESFVMPRRASVVIVSTVVAPMSPAEARRAEEATRAALVAKHGVRDLSKESDVLECDKRSPGRKAKPKAPKPEKAPRPVKPIPVDPRMAHVRSLGTAIQLKASDESGGKTIHSLQGINSETTMDRGTAMATALPLNQVALRFEGIRVQALNLKHKMRVDDPMVPTWYFYDATGEISQPHTFPTRSYMVGVDVLRVQAAAIGKLIREGTIDRAVLAMPRVDGEDQGKQWVHIPARTELVSVGSDGKMVPTREIAHAEPKQSKPDGANYQVCYILPTKAGVEALEVWCHSEAQAYTTALDLMSNGAVRVTIIGSGKQLSPERYPLTLGQTMSGRPLECWRFDGVSASLTRQGFSLLQKGALSTEKELEKERRQARLPNIWTKKHPKHDRIWMRGAKTDKATFSHG